MLFDHLDVVLPLFLATNFSWNSLRNLTYCLCIFFFFFSSRRRHTRLVSDWSSDVCSSDLASATDMAVSPTWRRFREAFRRHPTAIAGAVILLVMIGIALAAPWLGTVDPEAVAPIKRLKQPSLEFWFGSDMMGRDVYSRVMYGARVSLAVGIAVAILSTLIGLAIGLV